MVDINPPKQYDLLKDPQYMSPDMVLYFKNQLTNLCQSLLEKEKAISLSLTHEPYREPDPVDEGVNEELHFSDFAFQEHEDHLRREIELALQRIKEGKYGYCEETGEPIGVQRLMLVPYTRYCAKIQEQRELEKKRLKVNESS